MEQEIRELDTDQLRKGRLDLIHAVFNVRQDSTYQYNMNRLALFETELLSRYAEGLLSE